MRHPQDAGAPGSPTDVSRATLDALPQGVAVVDPSGTVALVTGAWARLDEHDGVLSGVAEGTDLLAALRSVRHGPVADDARQVLQGIEDLFEGRTDRFRLQYPGRPDSRWFRLTGAAVDGRVLLVREDDTARRRVLQDLAHRSAAQREAEREDALRLLAALTSGRRRLTLQPLDLAPHLDALHDAFRARVGETDRHLTKRVLGPLPTSADPRALDQAVLELLLNAHAATRPGGTLHLEAQVEGDEVRVCVIDDGRGFDTRELAARMEALDTEEHPEGVGLALVQVVMAHHAGELRISSDGQGAVAVLALPLRR